jgi:hypothetical protein
MLLTMSKYLSNGLNKYDYLNVNNNVISAEFSHL